MKKFTKITLTIAAILAALGIICCGIAAIMGAGWTTIHQKALAGEFDFGNWHIGNGIYYGSDHSGKQGKTESHTETFAASGIRSLKIDLDVVDSLDFQISDSTDTISVEMEDGYEKYFSTNQDGSELEITYNSAQHYFDDEPTITVVLPKECKNLALNLEIGVGDVSMESEAFTAENLYLSVGTGDVSMNQFSTKKAAELQVGTGDVSVISGDYEKMNIQSEVGDVSFSGNVSDKLQVKAGTGDVSVSLAGKEKEYAFDLSAGVGDITLNGSLKGSFPAEYKSGSDGGTKVEVTAGVGDIDVLTK